MRNESINVIFAGVGGQGNILVSHLLADAALEAGYPVLLTETFGAATRGGSVFSCVRIGIASAPLPRKHTCQVIIGLEPLEALRQAVCFLAPGGWVLVNTHAWLPVEANIGQAIYPSVEQILGGIEQIGGKTIAFNATAVAQELGSSRMMNIVLLGGMMALGIFELETRLLFAQMEKRWKPELSIKNQSAYQRGFALVDHQITLPARTERR
jgi:indolepyruvate ferredoxin oxidoreductase beta subunit